MVLGVMMQKDVLELAQLIVRRELLNFGDKTFSELSALYRFTNEDISSYFHHLKNKENVLTVIGSGCQVLNSILAGSSYIDAFDISLFAEYFMNLKLASIMALSKEEFLEYYFSDDREVIFCDDYYDKISEYLFGKYKEFWDGLYMFDDGYDIYNSLLFRSDVCLMNCACEFNPYLQENNYERLKNILKYGSFSINPIRCDITKEKITAQYDLVNLSNIMSYCYKQEDMYECIKFLRNHFNISSYGEIINYFYGLNPDVENILCGNDYVESMKYNNKLLVLRGSYGKN